MSSPTKRLFVAISLSGSTITHLTTLQTALSAKSKGGSFTLPENLHLTLAFLGECNETQTAAIKSAMDATAFDPFSITIDHTGYFNGRDGDIWWAGLSQNAPLQKLHHDLTHNLTNAGFTPEKRKFSPHITLARRVQSKIKPHAIPAISETAHKIHLMKSERVGGKLIYTSIYMRGKRTAPIVVTSYNPDWAASFQKIKSYLQPHISDLIVDIHHVGSTSVSGLTAKPIIDFDIEIPSMDTFPELKNRLEKLAFRHKGDYGITGREVFARETPDDFMEYHMYVCPSDSIELERHLKLRNYLRANPDAAKKYGDLKLSLAKKHQNDIDAYIDGKAAFILECLALAES